MRKLAMFNQVSLDGYFSGAGGDIRWLKDSAEDAAKDAGWNAFVAGNARAGGVLLFGRITYELMASYWPTPLAAEHDPIVAERMNSLPKVVFSRTLRTASWHNTTLMSGDPATTVRKMKSQPGPDLAILGSGSIVSQLAQEGLIDEYQIVVYPVALGEGMPLFRGLTRGLPLRLTNTRTFGNGNVLLCYAPRA
jgi:dihydrofolate reductase